METEPRNPPEPTANVPNSSSALAELIASAQRIIGESPAGALAGLEQGEATFGQAADPLARGKYCQVRAQAHAMLQQIVAAEKWAALGIEFFRECGFKRGIAAILNIRGVIASNSSRYAEAIGFHRETLALCRELDMPQGIGHAASNIALDYSYLGDYANALEYHGIALEAWRRTEDQAGLANALVNLGFLFTKLDRHDEALGHFQEADQRFESIGSTRNRIITRRNIATSLVACGRSSQALPFAE